MGNTGNSTGTHLHLELSTTQSWQCSSFLDPLQALGIPNVRGTVVEWDGSAQPVYTSRGIDVSENNGTINWQQVKQAEIDFAIIRVGWIGNNGNYHEDNQFMNNYLGAKNAGLQIGFYVYSYANSQTAYTDGANWMVGKIANLQNDVGAYLDLEDSSITLDKESLTVCAVLFCNIVQQAGQIAGVYANKSWFTTRINVNSLTSFMIWLAEWREGGHTADFKVDVWQYADNGHVNGINGNVDMNIWYHGSSPPKPPEPPVSKEENWKRWFFSKLYKLNIKC